MEINYDERKNMAIDLRPLPEMIDIEVAQKRCRQIRRRILDTSQKHGAIHIGGAFSCLEIIDTIYHSLMQKTSEGEYWDTFILSKGHGSMVLYAVLENLGIMPSEELERYCTREGFLGMHPDRGTPGIITSTGSLGHGLGMGAGMALYEKVNQENKIIFVVMSDGELQEGSVWEMMLQIPALGLTSIVGFVDNNNLQSLDFTDQSHPNFYPLVDKIEAFGWEAIELDGHDQKAIFQAVTSRSKHKPLFIICNTVKGKGVSFMENVPIWHYRSPNLNEYKQALLELSD